jgi:hypothetical protein
MVRKCVHGCGYKSPKNHHVKRHEDAFSCKTRKGKNTLKARTVPCPKTCGKFFSRKDVACKHAKTVCGREKKIGKKLKATSKNAPIASCTVKSCGFQSSELESMTAHFINEHLELFM